jgi:hypothetical protein
MKIQVKYPTLLPNSPPEAIGQPLIASGSGTGDRNQDPVLIVGETQQDGWMDKIRELQFPLSNVHAVKQVCLSSHQLTIHLKQLYLGTGSLHQDLTRVSHLM